MGSRRVHQLLYALNALIAGGLRFVSDVDAMSNPLCFNPELAELEAEGQAIVGPWDPNTRPSPQP